MVLMPGAVKSSLFICLFMHFLFIFLFISTPALYSPPDIVTSLPKVCIRSRWDPLTNLRRVSGPWGNAICHASVWACAGRQQQAGHRRQGWWFLRVIFCNFSSVDDTLGLLVTNLIVAPLCWLRFFYFFPFWFCFFSLYASGSMLDSTAVMVSA